MAATYSELYALLVISVGTALPLCHSVVGDESTAPTTFYLELFLLYLYGTSLLVLVYLMLYMVTTFFRLITM